MGNGELNLPSTWQFAPLRMTACTCVFRRSLSATGRAAALRGLARSVFINVASAYLFYRLIEPRFQPNACCRRRRERPGNRAIPVLFLDPPDHTRLHALFTKARTPYRVEGRRRQIFEMTTDFAQTADHAAGRIDFIRDFAIHFRSAPRMTKQLARSGEKPRHTPLTNALRVLESLKTLPANGRVTVGKIVGTVCYF
jgi:hypothetical protein